MLGFRVRSQIESSRGTAAHTPLPLRVRWLRGWRTARTTVLSRQQQQLTNVALLAHSMNAMAIELDLLADRAEDLAKASSRLLTLSAAVAVATSCITAWQTLIHRCIWLNLSNLSEGLQKKLLEAPISSEALFRSQLQTALNHMQKTADEADKITGEINGILNISGRGVPRQRLVLPLLLLQGRHRRGKQESTSGLFLVHPAGGPPRKRGKRLSDANGRRMNLSEDAQTEPYDINGQTLRLGMHAYVDPLL
ncbi:unnamed protein product [Pleuronectes platessa]|uniref:Uncharacterized protein n=1 Tax=Pleuronectes platessa TaxID=8262 RepID=A0A9N7TI45_PLEPL|nr:unnamed protein product [Pleuronectes platessa]